jgi:putative nucleotidyltransferase with HDIG domain
LCVLAVITEWFEVGMYGDSTFSVSVAIVFAAIYLEGFVGLVISSAAIVATHYVKHRQIAWYKPVFNWATHVLAGLVPIYGFSFFHFTLGWEELIPLTALTLVTALGYYAVESGLVSTAIGLAEKSSIRVTWIRQFGWTILFYVALCLIGLFMAILYSDLKGIEGILVFGLLMILIHLAQRQYVERTRASAQELIRMNNELTFANREIIQASLQIEHLNDELFVTLAKIIDARDPLVLDHSIKVAEYAVMIARKLALPADRVEKIHQAALLHDIGKIGISEELLKKPGGLTHLEYETVKTHTTLGGDLLAASRGLRHLAPFVQHHHEWWNGKGYPDQLEGEQIPLEARILAMADAIEAMTSDRPYHKKISMEQAVEVIYRDAGSQFDPRVADAFIQAMYHRNNVKFENVALPATNSNLSGLRTFEA